MAIEKLVSLNVERSYEELRRILLANECKIVAEDPPRSITVEHGSFWALTPRDVRKRIRFILIPQDSKTKIAAITSLASDYIALFIFAFISLTIIIPVGVWIVIDTENWAEETGYQRMLMLTNIAKILLAVSTILVLIGLISGIYTYVKRESFSEEILKMLT